VAARSEPVVTTAATEVPQKDDAIGMLRERMDVLARDLIGFWRTRGVDDEFGGFHGTLDREGNP
jgi:mannose/cellobiose epimerase-like protein (N-acyl-D-glucosamine 2-epimerase family)